MKKRIAIGAVLAVIILGGICAWQKARICNVADAVWRKVTAQSLEERIASIEARKPHLKQLADDAGERLVILVFKQERRLELLAPGWRDTLAYPLTAFSGTLGPKLKEGDGQIPEGVYAVTFLNPNSLCYLALRLNYPNADDQRWATQDGRTNLGSDIMIHGKNETFGCVALGDDAIEDLFYLAHAIGIQNIEVLIAPYDMRKGRNPEMEKNPSPWYPELCTKLDAHLRKALPLGK